MGQWHSAKGYDTCVEGHSGSREARLATKATAPRDCRGWGEGANHTVRRSRRLSGVEAKGSAEMSATARKLLTPRSHGIFCTRPDLTHNNNNSQPLAVEEGMKWFPRFNSNQKVTGKAPEHPEPAPRDSLPDEGAAIPPPLAAEPESKPRGRFGFLDAKRAAADRPSAPTAPPSAHHARPPRQDLPDRGLLPGSDGEHALQGEYGTEARAHGFYTRQVLDYLSPAMRDFIPRQEFLFVDFT